ncbi:TPA: ABC transporter permease [Staphylococcus aureus]|nr:ABC transporter permease [Staphylococcus aureus]
MFGSDLDSAQLLQALYETLYMVSIALFLGAVIGIPLGVLLVITRKQGIWPNIVIHQVLNPLINILRSLPFIILLIAIVPFTKLVVGTSIGTTAAIVPLTVYVAPYIARLVENSLLEVDEGIIEAAKAMGASPQIIRYFLIPEALGSLVLAITTAIIGLIGSTAMAGAVGGGGIGDLALVYGYQRFDTTVIIITVIVLVIIVQVIQTLGNVLARFIRRH